MSEAAGDERSRLLRALALSRRFHLFLAYCASPRAADALLNEIRDELPRLRKADVELIRLDPYEGRESIAPLEDRELADRVLVPLLSPPEEKRAHGVVHVVDASRATYADRDAWGRFFALWNEKRNALQQLGGEVVVVVPESLQRVFATAAPDVWSIRSGEYTIEEASGFEAIVAPGSAAEDRREVLGWYRAIPPLALFGGDLVVRPWIDDMVPDTDVGDIFAEPRDALWFQGDPRVFTQRALRSAERALAQRRFGDAEQLLRRVLEDARFVGTEIHLRAATALLVALAAVDRGEEALAAIPRFTPNDRLLQAEAYVHWCAGRLALSEATDARRSEQHAGEWDAQSRVLRSVERGEIAHAKQVAANLHVDPEGHPSDEEGNVRLVRADLDFLTGELEGAAATLGARFLLGTTANDKVAFARRFGGLKAFVDLARGDRRRAVLTLASVEIMITPDPELAARLSVLHSFTFGLLASHGKSSEDAVMLFSLARDHLSKWSELGLDRRSLHRASLAIDLAHATLNPAPPDPVAVARLLVERAVALLGDTGEDCIARVLAVEARRELARRLLDVGNDEARAEAHRALDLARPLGGRGVPAWDAILAATEREAHL